MNIGVTYLAVSWHFHGAGFPHYFPELLEAGLPKRTLDNIVLRNGAASLTMLVAEVGVHPLHRSEYCEHSVKDN